MVHSHRRFKADRGMAILTYIRCENMHRALARRRNTVMAGNAITNDTGVIEYCRLPRDYGMAVIAGIA